MADQYAGFTSPYYPSYSKPYDQCDCGQPPSCGNEHKSAMQVETITRATKGGGVEHINVIKPIGKFYADIAHRPFAVWDGSLALSSINPKTFSKYIPPALPYVCDRSFNAQLCSANGECNP